jgi:hypothetical protein
MRVKTIALVNNLSGQPFSGLIGDENQRNHAKPDERDNLQYVGPYGNMKAELKAGNKRRDYIHGQNRNNRYKDREFFTVARQLHVKRG